MTALYNDVILYFYTTFYRVNDESV